MILGGCLLGLAAVSALSSYLSGGGWIPLAVIGAALAEDLGAKLDSEVVALGQTQDGSISPIRGVSPAHSSACAVAIHGVVPTRR